MHRVASFHILERNVVGIWAAENIETLFDESHVTNISSKVYIWYESEI